MPVMPSKPRTTHPVSINLRVTVEQHAAIASIAAEQGVTHSEAARQLLERGYADLRRRIGQALVEHGQEPGEPADPAAAEAVGRSARFVTADGADAGEPSW